MPAIPVTPSTDPTPRLHATVLAVCPIVGLSIGTPGLSNTVTFTPTNTATANQITAAQNAITSFDWSSAAQTAWQLTQDRTSANNLLSDLAAQNKLLRGAIFTLLDYLNTVLGTPKTVATLKSDIQAKINSGAADS